MPTFLPTKINTFSTHKNNIYTSLKKTKIKFFKLFVMGFYFTKIRGMYYRIVMSNIEHRRLT